MPDGPGGRDLAIAAVIVLAIGIAVTIFHDAALIPVEAIERHITTD